MEFIKNNIKIIVTKRRLTENYIHTFLNNTEAKIILYNNQNLSFDNIKYEPHFIKKRFHGQSYATIPFAYSFDNSGSIQISITSDAIKSLGECKVSKRKIKELYSMYRASKNSVNDKALAIAKSSLSQLANILNGNIFDIEIIDSITDSSLLIKNFVTSYEDFYGLMIEKLKLVDVNVRNTIQSLTSHDEFIDLFNKNNPKEIF